jgi:hypothetical protein
MTLDEIYETLMSYDLRTTRLYNTSFFLPSTSFTFLPTFFLSLFLFR